MSEWKKVKLKDICSKIIDCVNKTAPVCDYETPYKMLRTSDIRNGQINTEGLKCVTKETFEKWNRRGYLQKGDVIFTREAPVGEVGWLKDPKNLFLGQRLMFFRTDNNKCDNRFLFYSLSFSDNKRNIIAMSNGSTVNHLRVPDCENIEISIPDLPIQHRIATILSRYDSLIENYQKQIKLLEEAAQRLYKEWFVDLHFPGHENTKIVDGVPEGWDPSQLGQLAVFKRGKTITKKDAVEGDIPVVAGGLEPAYYCNKSNTAERVITVSGSGANAGFTRMYFENVWASDCSFVDASTTPFLHFVYCYLKGNKTTIDNMQKGAAQPHVYAKDINALDLCVPNKNVLKSFENKVSKYFDSIASLQSQIRLLTETRDRLLPKLMSGEIDVVEKQPER